MVEMTSKDELIPFQLSGGMHKHVGVPPSFGHGTEELIFFDEPTQGLDPVIGALINELIIRISLKEAETTSDRRHAFDGQRVPCHHANGHVVFSGKLWDRGTPEHMRQSKSPVLVQFS